MRRAPIRIRLLAAVVLTLGPGTWTGVLAQGPALRDCALLVPEAKRIQNYQLLAPQMSFDGRFLAYETLIGERRELYISDTQDWARHQVRAKPNELFRKKESFESELDWFPSQGYQNWYTFVTGDRNNFDIYLADATREQQPIPLVVWDSNDHQPVFSPNGKDLAFISTRGRSEGTDLYVVLDVDRKLQDPAADVQPIRLTNSSSGVLYPAWSPDGRFLSFTMELDEDGVVNDGISLIEMGKLRPSLRAGQDASGQARPVRVTSPQVFPELNRFDEVAASWSPDGSYIAFYMTEHVGGRRAQRSRTEKVQHRLGLVQVRSFENDVTFLAAERTPLADRVLDPNADSFLRGPVWSLDSRWLVVAKDSPEEDNPIRLLGVPGGEVYEEAGTKLNRDVSAARGAGGLTVILFSAHDRQTTSVYRCELR
jgi:Tol biopolymer transport system component